MKRELSVSRDRANMRRSDDETARGEDSRDDEDELRFPSDRSESNKRSPSCNFDKADTQNVYNFLFSRMINSILILRL